MVNSMNKSKIITFVILRFLAIFLFFISFFDQYVGTIFYFTVQSNILVIIVLLILNIYDILKLQNKINSMPNFIYRLKYISVVGISLTFLIFGLILTPIIVFKTDYPFYVLSISSLSMHLIIPIISILDWFVNDYLKNPRLPSFLIPLTFPLYYLGFAMTCSVVGVKYKDFFNMDVDNHVPYFFLDYKKYGWFKIKLDQGLFGFGVVYWIVGIAILVTFISFIYLYIKKLSLKNKK